MVYTPDDVVWTFNVKQQKEVVTGGHQTSHRLNEEGLKLLKKKTPRGTPDPKMEMRRNFIFQDFLHDPLATRYFHEYLEQESDSGCLMLDFYEEMQYIDTHRKQLQDASESMLEDFLATGNGDALGWDRARAHEVLTKLQTSIRSEVSFGQMGGLSEEVRGYLRKEHFNSFLESHRFKKLEQVITLISLTTFVNTIHAISSTNSIKLHQITFLSIFFTLSTSHHLSRSCMACRKASL